MKYLLIFFLLISSLFSSAQTLFTYGNYEVSKQEFLRAINKNSNGKKPTEKDYRDYLELYTRFKLKVQEAYDRKMDTLLLQREDIQSLRNELADAYTKDDSALLMLVNEAFLRSKKDLRIALDDKEVGWITVFVLPYKIETIAYTTAVGQTSDTFSTSSGVHRIKVLEERPAVGKMKAAQILLLFPPDADESVKKQIKLKADSIYDALKKKASFEKLAKAYSNDNLTYQIGGEMPEFTVGKYSPEFEKAVFALAKNGDITKPILTQMGYHIVKRLALTPVNTNKNNADAMAIVHQQVLNDNRMSIARKAMVEKIYRITGLSPVAYDEDKLLAYYRDNLEKYSPEFAAQIKDFREGNLLFDIMQCDIWDKATNDSTGLQNYYLEHKDKYKGSSFDKVRGNVLNDYQAYLEEKWIEELKKKYPVKVNEEVFTSLYARGIPRADDRL